MSSPNVGHHKDIRIASFRAARHFVPFDTAVALSNFIALGDLAEGGPMSDGSPFQNVDR